MQRDRYDWQLVKQFHHLLVTKALYHLHRKISALPPLSLIPPRSFLYKLDSDLSSLPPSISLLQMNFLNSVIVDLQRKNEELKVKLKKMALAEFNGNDGTDGSVL